MLRIDEIDLTPTEEEEATSLEPEPDYEPEEMEEDEFEENDLDDLEFPETLNEEDLEGGDIL